MRKKKPSNQNKKPQRSLIARVRVLNDFQSNKKALYRKALSIWSLLKEYSKKLWIRLHR